MQCTTCSNRLWPIVAVDLDGTLGRYHRHFLRMMDDYFGRRMRRSWNGVGEWEDHLELSRREYEDVKLAFRQGGFKRWMQPYSGAIDFVLECKSAGAEIWVTTTRPYMRLDSVDPDTRFWLDKYDVPYDHLLYDDEKYRKLYEIVGAGRVVAVVDDLPKQFLEASAHFGSDACFLMERKHNSAWRGEHPNHKHQFYQDFDELTVTIVERINAWER